jgi:hypothetical protein
MNIIQKLQEIEINDRNNIIKKYEKQIIKEFKNKCTYMLKNNNITKILYNKLLIIQEYECINRSDIIFTYYLTLPYIISTDISVFLYKNDCDELNLSYKIKGISKLIKQAYNDKYYLKIKRINQQKKILNKYIQLRDIIHIIFSFLK